MQQLIDLYNKPLPETAAWIDKGILPKSSILLLGGEAKIGKSLLVMDLMHYLRTGSCPWLPVAELPRAVLYIEQEIGEIGLQMRVKTRYRDVQPPGGIFICSKHPDFYHLDKVLGRDALYRAIDETGAQVVVIDPISRCFLGDENSNTEVNRLFVSLDMVLERYRSEGLSIVLVHHFGKPPLMTGELNRDPLSPYNFRGASKWFDAPDALITMIKQTPGPGEWLRVKIGFEVRHGEHLPPKLLAIKEPGWVHEVCLRGLRSAPLHLRSAAE